MFSKPRRNTKCNEEEGILKLEEEWNVFVSKVAQLSYFLSPRRSLCLGISPIWGSAIAVALNPSCSIGT